MARPRPKPGPQRVPRAHAQALRGWQEAGEARRALPRAAGGSPRPGPPLMQPPPPFAGPGAGPDRGRAERSRAQPSGAERGGGGGGRGRGLPLSPGRRDAADVPRAPIGGRQLEGAGTPAAALSIRWRTGGRRGRAGGGGGGGMPGLWERLAGGERGRLETSDCESLGSASGSEGGERGSPRRGAGDLLGEGHR